MFTSLARRASDHIYYKFMNPFLQNCLDHFTCVTLALLTDIVEKETSSTLLCA